MEFVFWISLLFVVYTFLGYPLVIVCWSKLFPKPIRLDMESFEWPSVTMIIIAYNEEENILRKIENCRELDYPNDLLEICIVSDGSTDGTNDILIAQPDIHVIIDEDNHGKPYQINRVVEETESEVIIFSDARQTFEKNAVIMLVRNFSDSKIGAVSGELVFVSPEDHTERSIGLYWKYEKILRKAESAVNSTFGVTGAIYAIRRELFAPMPEDTILDDVEIPLHIFRNGFRVIFEPEAMAYDSASSEVSREFQRKTRTLTGNFQLFGRNLWLFNPARNKIFFQALSHKAFRLFVPYALMLILIGSFVLEQPLYKALLYSQLVLYIAGICATRSSSLKQNRILNFISVFLLLNTASVAALFKYAFRSIDAKWKS